MKWLLTQINSLPSPVRHALLTLFVLEGSILVNGFAGAEQWPDIKTAALAIPAALAVGLIRWATQTWGDLILKPGDVIVNNTSAPTRPCTCAGASMPKGNAFISRTLMADRVRNFGTARGALQVTLNQELHELLTQPVSAEEAASPAPLVYHGGKLIDKGRARIFNVHLGTPDYDVAAFDEFAKAVVEDGYYRSPDGADVSPGTFLGSARVAWPWGASLTITDAQIQAWVDAQTLAGLLPAQDGYTQVMLLFPPNTTVVAFNEQSCSFFCGYHSKTARGNYYSVQNDTTCSGCHGSFSPLAGLQMVYAHEYGEFRSDPDGDGWTVDQPGTFQGWENGDLCAWVQVAFGPAEKGWSVQPLATNDRGCYVLPYDGGQPVPQSDVTVSLVVATQPANAVVGVRAPDFVVNCLGADGQLNTLDSSTLVTMTLPGFSDTQTLKAVAGVCRFAGETFRAPHSRIAYFFAAPSLEGISSNPFDVTAAAPPPPSGVVISQFDIVVTVNGVAHQLHILGGSI